MKLAALPKKAKSALGKVSKGQISKREKDSTGIKKTAMLSMASESLSTPQKIKAAKSPKLKKLSADSSDPAIAFQKVTVPTKKGAASPKNGKAGSGLKSPLVKKGKSKTKKVKRIGNETNAEKAGSGPKSPLVKKGKSITKKVKRIGNKSDAILIKKKVKKTKKNLAVVKKPEDQDDVDRSLNEELLEGVCSNVLKLFEISQDSEGKKDLFNSLPQPILLTFNVFKIPETPSRTTRCLLPNSIHTSDPDVCLILPDIVRGRMRDVTFANYVEQYEDKLREAGVKGIKQIIPFAQLRAEYSQFELKRRLGRTFDIFLCDGRIQDHCFHFLGGSLKKENKVLMPVRALKVTGKEFEFSQDLQKSVDQAVRKVGINVHATGTDTAVTIGHSHLSGKQLADNIQAVWTFLNQELPGGIKNIRCAHLKGLKTMPIPLYASLVLQDKVPVVKRAPKCETVEDELSTCPGFRAVVYPDGAIKLVNQQTAEDVQFMKDGSIKTSKRAQENLENETAKRLKIEADVSDEDEEGDDKDVNAAELAYLSQWSENNLPEDEDEDVPKKKLKKIIPKNIPKQVAKQPMKKGISQKLNKVAPKKIKNQEGKKKTPKVFKGKSKKA